MKLKQIIDALQAKLTGLTSIGENVFQNRVYPLGESELPGINIRYGAQAMEQYSNAQVNNTVEFGIEIYCKGSESALDDTLIKIQTEVHAAIMADYQQGLPFVIDTNPLGASEPIMSDDGEKPIATQTINFSIMFRHSLFDLSQ